MYRQMVEDCAKSSFAKIIEDIFGYWKVYDYLKFKLSENVLENIVEFNDIKEYWYAILKNEFCFSRNVKYVPIANYQKVKIRNCFLSDWIPKLPGKIWTIESLKEIEKPSKYFEEMYYDSELYFALNPDDKMRHMSAGYGSIRLNDNLYSNSEYYYCLSATSQEFWNVDYGVPIVVSKSVYKEYLKHSKNGAPEVELNGIYCQDIDIPFKELIVGAIGASVDDNLQSILTKSTNLPKSFIYVASPLLCTFKENDSHPDCTAWTCFENEDTKYDYKYLFTYSHFNPNDSNSIKTSIKFINEYVRRHRGKRIITDFDGKISRLESTVKMNTDPMINAKVEAKSIIMSCSNDYEKIKRRI